MSTQQDKNAEALLELADVFELAATKLRVALKGTGVIETKAKPAYDVTQMHWEQRPSAEKGPFEIAEKNKNLQSTSYAALDTHLQGKPKGDFISGMYYWRFTSGDAIGRRKPKKGTP
jgi:hypothetical protein